MKTKLIFGSLLALTGMTLAQNNYIPGLSPSGGNIGINLPSAPTEYNLQVNGSIGMQYGNFLGVTNTGWAWGQTHIMLTSWDATVGDYLSFYTPGSAGSINTTEKMRITCGGNVGIGTAAPATPLHVVGSGTGLRAVTTNGSSSYAVNGQANGVSNSGTAIGVTGSGAYGSTNMGGYFTGYGASGASARGIYSRVLTPQAGDYAGYFSGNVNIDGQAFCTSSSWSSDLKLKKDIQPLADGLEKIRLLKPSTYLFKDDAEFKDMNLPKEQQLGLIAQDLEKVYPYLVTELAENIQKDEKGNVVTSVPSHKMVNYIGLIPVVISAIQEQDKAMQQQQQTIANQQKEIDALKQQMSISTGINQASASDPGFAMDQNEPNPFTNETVVKYTLPQNVNNAQMVVYDLTGKQITSFPITDKGSSSMTITSEKLSAGIYIYSIVADGKLMDSKRMIISGK